MTTRGTVVVLAKAPIAGRVKTRLCPPLEPCEAASLAAAALADTLAVVSSTRCARRVVAFDAPPDGWIPPGFDVIRQPSGGLGHRLAAAFAAARGPTVLVGMDTPQITSSAIEHAQDCLRHESDAVLGPAFDGGYWLVGLATPDPRAFLGVPMSTKTTATAQRARLAALGLRTTTLPTLRDVDYYSDALAVAAEAPSSRFSEVWAALTSRTDPRQPL